MKFISLFAGIGGFDLALTRLGHECVYANEWDKYATQTYEKNFGHKPDTRSITDVPVSDIPDHDLLCGGFPCQSFSVAGKRGGFADVRGTLFFEIARILKERKPRLLFLENVKGLLSHEQGKTFGIILNTLDELGYDLQWQVLNSKNHGVPQNRERVFIIGHLRGTGRPQVFPLGKTNGICNESRTTEKEVCDITQTITTQGGRNAKGSYIAQTLTARQFASWNGNYLMYDGGSIWNRVYDPKGASVTVRAQGGGGGAKTGLYMVGDEKIRRLTPIECERLQGFPDNWTAGVSDAQRYKQMGNAVTVNVIYDIAKHL